MSQRISIKEVLDCLEDTELTQKQEIRLLGILNKKLNTFPLTDVITKTIDGGILANGQKIGLEELVKFRQGISILRDNWAFQLLADQILYLSMQTGIHYGDSPDKIMFARYGAYFITKFRELIELFDNKYQ